MKSWQSVLFRGAVIGAVCSQLALSQQSGNSGVVSGHVLDFSGRPVKGATVTFVPIEAAITGIPVEAFTDGHGYYQISVPALGREKFYAHKEADGYPDSSMAVLAPSDLVPPEVDVKPGGSYPNVDINLGKPGGRLTIEAYDKETGKPINAARVTLRLKETPAAFLSTSFSPTGIFQTPLPSRPITVTVIAPGFREWKYLDVATGHDYVEVRPYESKDLRAELIPSR